MPDASAPDMPDPDPDPEALARDAEGLAEAAGSRDLRAAWPQAHSKTAEASGSHAREGKRLPDEGQGADGIMESVARLWSDAAAVTIGRMAMD